MDSSSDEFLANDRETLNNVYMESCEVGTKHRWFGSWIIMKGNSINVDDEVEDVIISTQLEQVKGADMTARGRNISRRWSCWNVYDAKDSNFIYGIRSSPGSGIEVTKMKCIQCRNAPRRKCRYESACIKFKAVAGRVGINDNEEMQERLGVQIVLNWKTKVDAKKL